MQVPFLILASGDSWIGFLIFIIIAVLSSFSKMMQKGQPEMPEELPPRPVPPQHRPPVVTQRPRAPQPQQTRRSLTEEQVQDVLRRMRKSAQPQVPPPAPPIVETVEAAPRRLVRAKHGESELPSEHPEAAPREAMPSSVQPSRTAAAPVAVLSSRTSLYREQLRSRMEIRRAIVLRELLGPPLALRQDW